MSTNRKPFAPILAYGIEWKTASRLAVFKRLMACSPQAFVPDAPKPLALSTRERLEKEVATIVAGMVPPQPSPKPYGRTVIRKTIKAYCRTEAYLQASITGQVRINLEGEVEGVVTEGERAIAKVRWWKKYDPTRVVMPQPPKKKKKKPEPPPKKTLKLPIAKKAKLKPKSTPPPVKKKRTAKGQKPQQPASSRMRGQIVHYNAERGFGFIMLLQGGPRIFFHRSAIREVQVNTQQLIDQRVTFRVVPSNSGPGSFSAIQIKFDDA